EQVEVDAGPGVAGGRPPPPPGPPPRPGRGGGAAAGPGGRAGAPPPAAAPRSRLTPSPGRVGRAKQPSAGSTAGAPCTRSLTHGSAKSLKCSRTLYLAVATARCRVAGGATR